MSLAYYPGCTLKTKAKNLEEPAIASMEVLGFKLEEITRWNCCGAVHSLADDDLIHQVAPVRNLIRTTEQGK
ncbi:MAG: heterodisulfide reductase, subunit B, partial [Chloroflexi bacterium]